MFKRQITRGFPAAATPERESKAELRKSRCAGRARPRAGLWALLSAVFVALAFTPLFAAGDSPDPDYAWYTQSSSAESFSIDTAEELYGLAHIVNGSGGSAPSGEAPSYNNFSGQTIRLTKDIDLSAYGNGHTYAGAEGEGWIPIGLSGMYFAGTFDGQDHSISGLYLSGGNGLFGGLSGTVENLLVTDVNSVYDSSGFAVGGVAGQIYGNGVVKNCSVSGSINGLVPGGIAGIVNNGGRVEYCTVSANVSGSEEAGGIAGRVIGGSITNCSVSGTVGYVDRGDGVAAEIGGIAGMVSEGGSITDSYSTGDVTGALTDAGADDGDVGGIAGSVTGGNVTSCYSAGDVRGAGSVGGVVGDLQAYSAAAGVSNCYSTGAVTVTGAGTSNACFAGGVVGRAFSSSNDFSLVLRGCYAAGSVSNTVGGDSAFAFAGGVVGYMRSDYVTVEDCAALNPNITAEKHAGRVTGGDDTGTGALSGNIAFANITVSESGTVLTVTDGDHNNTHGLAKTAEQLQTADGFPAVFTSEPWTYEAGKLPILAGLSGQDGTMPAHLSPAAAPDGSALYNAGDVAAINAIIRNNGLTGYSENDPENWNIGNFVSWTSESTGKRVQSLNIPSNKNLSGVLDVSALSELKSVTCRNNLLTGINAEGAANLKSLYCDDNQIVSLGALPSKLEILTANNNRIASLGTLPQNLNTLYLDNNDIAALNVSGLANLKNLDCSGNSLVSFTSVSGKTLTVNPATGGDAVISVRVDKYISTEPGLPDAKIHYSLIATPAGSYEFSNWNMTGTVNYLVGDAGSATAEISFSEDVTATPVFSGASSAISQIFPDDILAAWVAGQLSTNTDATPTIEQLSAITGFLDLSGQSGFTDWTGIEYLTGLGGLDFQNTGVTGSIADFNQLTNLESLGLAWTNVTGDIAEIAAMTKLTNLGLHGTNAGGDIADIAHLTQMENLGLDNTQVEGDIAALANMSSLHYLGLCETNVTGDIEDMDIANMIGLTSISLDGTAVTGDLSHLAGLHNLHSLYIHESGLTGDVSAFGSLTGLTELYFNGTDTYGDLSALSGLTALSILRTDNTGVYGDLSALSGLTGLTSLTLNDLQIELSPINFSDGPVSVAVPVKDRLGEYIVPTWITGGSYANGEVTWAVPSSESGVLSYSFETQVTIGFLTGDQTAYSGTVRQPYTKSPQSPALYNAGDVAAINAIIRNNGLTGYNENDPENWNIGNFVSWTSESTGKRVQSLNIPSNKNLSGVLDVSALSELKSVTCRDNLLTGINAEGAAKLERLWCDNNQIVSLGTLPPKLEVLTANNNRIASLGTLPQNLNTLYLDNNDLAALNVSGLANLKNLDCSGNSLVSFTSVSGKTLTVNPATGGDAVISVRVDKYTSTEPGLLDAKIHYSLIATPAESYEFSNWNMTGTVNYLVGDAGSATAEISFSEDVTATPVFKGAIGFTMGRDNYRFINYYSSFGYSNPHYFPLERFQALYPAALANALARNTKYSKWPGSCFGFSTTSMLFFSGALTASGYQNGAKNTHDFLAPAAANPKNEGLIALMEAYQLGQFGSKVQAAMNGNKNKYEDLEEAVRDDGLAMIFVVKGNSGHALVVYGIEDTGGGAYALSIYDCNYPEVNDKKMHFNPTEKSWSYAGNGIAYSSAYSDSWFTFVPQSVFEDEIGTAIVRYSAENGVPMPLSEADAAKYGYESPAKEEGVIIMLPNQTAAITGDGKSVDEIPGAHKYVPIDADADGEQEYGDMYYVPDGVYSVVNAQGGPVVFVDYEMSFSAETDNENAVIEGKTGDDGYVRILCEDDSAFKIQHMTNATAQTPITINGSGKGTVQAALSGEALLLSGNGRVTVDNGSRSRELTLSDRAIKVDADLNVSTKSGGGNSTGGRPVAASAPETEEEKSEQTQAPGTATETGLFEAFRDVSPSDWYYDDVKFAVEKGLFKGVSSDEFAPQAQMTRAMFATVLYRLAGEPATAGNSAFGDVTADRWFTNAVAWASASGVITGYSADVFGANDNITREQIAIMLYRCAKLMSRDVSRTADLSSYADEGAVSEWAREALAWANAAGFITGRDADTLAPADNATRAEAAAILHRFADAAGN